MSDPIFQAAGTGLALLDLEGRFIRVNPALQELFEMSEADLLGKCLHDCCVSSDADICFDMIQEIFLADGAMQEQELRLLPATDRPLWVHVTAGLLNDSATRLSCIVLTVHDSSDYFELLEELQDSSECIGCSFSHVPTCS